MNNPSLEIIREIRERLPKNTSLIDFFTEIIPMNKEAAYRRLRGDVPLTLNETLLIASYLNLSLDKIFEIKEENTYTSSMIRMNGNNLMYAYGRTIELIIEALQFIKTDPNAKIYAANLILPNTHIFKYPILSKFRFFKWAYQCRSTLNPLRLSEIKIPDQIRHLEIKYQEESQQIATYYVWIKELFGSFIKDIYYFQEIGLVTEEEIKVLREESNLLLDDLDIDISTGQTKAGAPFLVYLANTYFDANYSYIKGNNFKASSINIFGINYLSFVEKEISDDTKQWIESLMRYSTLISKSGEIEKMSFFDLQRKMIQKTEEKPNTNNIHGICL